MQDSPRGRDDAAGIERRIACEGAACLLTATRRTRVARPHEFYAGAERAPTIGEIRAQREYADCRCPDTGRDVHWSRIERHDERRAPGQCRETAQRRGAAC